MAMIEKLAPTTLSRVGGFADPTLPNAESTRLITAVAGQLKLPAINTTEAALLLRCVRAAVSLCEHYVQNLFYRRDGEIVDTFVITKGTNFIKLDPYAVHRGHVTMTRMLIGTFEASDTHYFQDQFQVGYFDDAGNTLEPGNYVVATYTDARPTTHRAPQAVDHAVVLVAASMYSLRLGEPIEPGLGQGKEIWLERSGAKSILDNFESDRIPRERNVTRIA